MSAPRHYVEIETVDLKRARRQFYRFHGRGKWELKEGSNEWRPINAIYVPARILEIAAANCEPGALQSQGDSQ